MSGTRPFPAFPLIFKKICFRFPPVSHFFFKKKVPGKLPSFLVPVDFWLDGPLIKKWFKTWFIESDFQSIIVVTQVSFADPKLFPVYFLWWQFLTVTMINNFDNDHFNYHYMLLFVLSFDAVSFDLGLFRTGTVFIRSVLIEVSFDQGSILNWVSFDWFSFDLVQFRFWPILIRASFDLGQFRRQICSIYTFLKMKEQSCKKHSLTNWI